MTDDAGWMAEAIALGARARGRSAPNPNVGCVIVKDGEMVGEGWTQPGGRPTPRPSPLPRPARAHTEPPLT